MKEKVKAFFAAIGYLFIALLSQLSVSIIGGIIISVFYVINEMSNISGGVNPISSDLDGLLEFTVSLTNVFLLISSILTVLILFLIYKIRKKNCKEELQIKKTNSFNICFAIILGISCWLFNSGVLSLIDEAGLFTSQFDYMENMLAPLSSGSIIISIIAVGIVAPFAEEFLFRGVIYNTLSKKISIKWTIIIQAILFGVFHFNLVQGAYATLLGLVFGYITYKTKSLWPAIIVHMVNNLIATIAPYVLSESFGGNTVYIIFSIIGAIGVTIGLLLTKNKNVNNDEDFAFTNSNNF
ncbi:MULTISPECIES: type II CAAX endopeptidase family protein [unclassified Clostridium]|uniref:CPBP family intramembrane glutamic endopeptidase n=1 Tax=unclassified Clostridium TaxID=2614128 RepID=UPI002A7489F3|nr:type II CAAX endopeptidase family protein [Clostridium sp.]MDY2631631.1 type II CAAX endopeptidase family protein [Clostridium sp.]MDY4251624.1 type II CAAX endopeptidase family protein [Clostridium sp.]